MRDRARVVVIGGGVTGFDASAHMSEETRRASVGAARGMVMSVVVSGSSASSF